MRNQILLLAFKMGKFRLRDFLTETAMTLHYKFHLLDLKKRYVLIVIFI